VTLLVVTAVDAERDAVLRDLGVVDVRVVAGYDVAAVSTPAGIVHAVAAGVGPVASAVATSTLLAMAQTAGEPYALVCSAGIAGGFAGRATIGDVTVGSATTFADLGARTDDGLLGLADLGLAGDSSYRLDAQPFATRLSATTNVVVGEILTLAAMTGTDAEAAQFAARHPNAVAEAMEGFGVATAARRRPEKPLYVTEIRAISNTIGRRDRAAWDIPRALAALSAAFVALVKEPLP
jgi:futalosine hydrolase